MKDTDPPDANIDPKPFKVPLTFADVRPGTAVRMAGHTEWMLITRADEDGVDISNWATFSWEELLEKNYEIKRPAEDWLPAFKWDVAV